MRSKLIVYPDISSSLWTREVEKLLPFLSGKGVDVGSARRVVFQDQIRVDLDNRHDPDVCCSGDDLPFEEGKFDYLTSIHSFEHFENQVKMLNEWVRVIRKNGIIAIVHPDVGCTGVFRPNGLKSGENPYNEHKHEKTYSDFLEWFKNNGNFGLEILESGVAYPGWSFYIIFKKK